MSTPIFTHPETVAEQKARLAGEAAKLKQRMQLEQLLDRAATKLTARLLDTTGDLFADGQELFNRGGSR